MEKSGALNYNVHCIRIFCGEIHLRGEKMWSSFRTVIQLYIERKDWFLELTGAHITLSLTAVLLAGITGLLLGIWIAECPKASGPVLTVANICYTIPSISLLGMLIPLLGIGNPTAVVALTLYGIMPMVRNTYAGITGVSSDIVSAAEAMGSTRAQIMLKIKLPPCNGSYRGGGPQYGSHDDLGCGNRIVYRSRRAWRRDLTEGSRYYDTAMTFSGSFLIALIAIVSDGLLGIVGKEDKRKECTWYEIKTHKRLC